MRYDYPNLDETLYKCILPNGLTVAVVPKKGFARTAAYFAADYGSIHTDFTFAGRTYKVPAGIAHYLEHKLFDMPDGRDVSAEFAAMGASVNAFTSYDMTAYYFTTTRQVPDCLRLLLEFVSTPYFTEESVERERGIIDQEINMNLDTPDSVIFDDLMEQVYRKHPVRVPILGTCDSIREITPEMLYLCHRAFYTPSNMLLCVVGDVEPETVCAIAESVLGSEPKSMGTKIRNWQEEMTVCESERMRTMEVAMPTFDLAFKCEAAEPGEEAVHQEIVAELAAEALLGESSELYLRLYDEGLIDSSFGGGFETVDGCAMVTVSGDSDDPEAVREAILTEVAGLLKAGISEEAFLRLKRSSLGRRIRGMDSFDGLCFRICAYHFSDFDYFRFPQIYSRVTREEVLEFLRRVIAPERCAMTVIAPTEA